VKKLQQPSVFPSMRSLRGKLRSKLLPTSNNLGPRKQYELIPAAKPTPKRFTNGGFSFFLARTLGVAPGPHEMKFRVRR
jgi:hypothetical protein